MIRITKNEWSPLFSDLKRRISDDQRKILLSRIMGGIQDLTQKTMGKSGQNRPEPWRVLTKKYADKWKNGDREPTLLMSDQMHALRNPTLPHLIDSFLATVDSSKASLTNASPYADVHQMGMAAVPKRPYYPVDESGLTQPAQDLIKEKLDCHFQQNPF